MFGVVKFILKGVVRNWGAVGAVSGGLVKEESDEISDAH
jgi:hypothetical protein